MKATALGLLAAGMAARYGWKHAPEWAQADVWNASLAIFIMLVLGLLAATYRRRVEVILVCAYLALLWAFTAGCSLLWLHEQWEVLPGQDQCDARFRLPLSVMGLFVGLVIIIMIRSARRERSTGT